MMLVKSFFRRISKDFRHKELLPLKLIFFVQASTLYVLYPYLTIHMRELGISVEEAAIMSAITPFIAMVMPPMAGMVADRIGNFKILLSLFSAFGGLAALLLLLVPIGRVTVKFPDRVVMDLGCTGNNELIYSMSQNHPCEPDLKPEVFTRIESCGYTCVLDIQNETDIDTILSSRAYTLTRFDLGTNSNYTSKFTLAQNAGPVLRSMAQKEEMREHRQLENNEYFRTSIRQLSKVDYFFPTNRLHDFTCTASGFIEDFETSTLDSSRIYENRTLCTFNPIAASQINTSQTTKYHSYKTNLKELERSSEDLLMERRRFSADRMCWNCEDYQKITCGNPDPQNERTLLTLPLFENATSTEAYRTLSTENCSKRCIVSAPREQVCSNKNMVIEYNVRMTFWLYLGIRVFISIIGGTTFAMFEGAVIAILREQKADYGLQRIYGSIGGMISSPLSGWLIDYASTGKSYTDFRPAFYLYTGLKLISGILMMAINLEFKSPSTSVVRDVFVVLRNVEAAALFIACFVLGTAWGYIESFLFWLIQDLGGSSSLMGITITVGGIAGIPLLVLSGPIISRIGHANVLFIGFIFYAIRLCGYSLIYNPWHTLIFEALESVTLSLSFTAAVTYAARLSTTTTDSSIQGLLGGVYYGVGKGSGSLIGGYLMKAFGTRPTYRIFAVITLITGIIYYIFNAAYLRKRPQVEGNDIVKKKPKKVENQNGLDNGVIEIGLEEKKQRSKNEEQDSRERENGKLPKAEQTIEVINNARNLDQIEKSPIEERKKSDSNETSDPEAGEQDRTKDHSQQNGMTNPGFDDDEEENPCDMTVKMSFDNAVDK